MLYRKGRLTSSCTFILSGNIGYFQNDVKTGAETGVTGSGVGPGIGVTGSGVDSQSVSTTVAVTVKSERNYGEKQETRQGSGLVQGLGQRQASGLGLNQGQEQMLGEGQALGQALGLGLGLGLGQGQGSEHNNELTPLLPDPAVTTLEPWSAVAADTLVESDGAFLPDHTYFITR